MAATSLEDDQVEAGEVAGGLLALCGDKLQLATTARSDAAADAAADAERRTPSPSTETSQRRRRRERPPLPLRTELEMQALLHQAVKGLHVYRVTSDGNCRQVVLIDD
jgi:hypothetical protein